MSAEPTTAVRFGDVEIDAWTRSVRRAGVEVQLRQQAFDVLLHLVHNRNRVVSKAELFSAIWNDSAVTEDALVQCIVEIRKVVGDDSRSPWFLRTVPKQGYRVIAEPALGPASHTTFIEIEEENSVDIEIREEGSASRSSRVALAVAIFAAAISLGVAGWLLVRSPFPDKALRPDDQGQLSSRAAVKKDAMTYYAAGMSHARASRHDQAVSMFQRAVSIDPGFAMAYARIGYAYGVVWNEAEKGRPYLTKALEHVNRLDERERLYVNGWDAITRHEYGEAITIFQNLVQRFPVEIEAHHRLAALLAGELRTEEAIRVLETAIVIDPRAAELHNAVGGHYSGLGRHAEAIAAHQRYVRLRPREADAEDSLGLTYQRAAEPEKALHHYERALQLDRGFKPASIHRGNVLCQMGRCREALQEFERYLTITPLSEAEQSRGYASIAAVHLRMGDTKRAEEFARRAITDDPLSKVQLFLVHLATEDLGAAEKMRDSLEGPSLLTGRGRRPNLREPFYARAVFEAQQGRAEAALEFARKAVVYAPLYWTVEPLEEQLGDIYLILGRLPDAIEDYERAVRANPSIATVRLKLAKAYARAGRADDARREATESLKLWSRADRGMPQLAEARALLN